MKEPRIFVRVTPEEKEALEAVAKRESLSLSAWVRSTLLKIARKK